MLVDILFIFCKLNPDVSYRQGMHEILAPIVWVIERDAIDLGQSSKILGEDAVIKDVFDAEFIEHDTFALFAQVMQSAKNFYEHTTMSGKENPMVARSRRIFGDMLPLVDEKLAKHLENIDIVPQIFLIRWVRLLFGREFEFDELLTVWDVIFAEDPTLEVVDHISLVMLLRIHWDLIDADYNLALTLLLKYPAPGKELLPQTLVLDALYLREHMDQYCGSHLVSKYTGRPLQHGGRPMTPPALQRNITTFAGRNTSKATSSDQSSSPSRGPRLSRNFEGVLQSTARNLYARGEKLAIGKAVRSAVDEVHRKAQEIREAPTPSPPVAPRQGGLTMAEAQSLQGRVKALEERSKQLAKLLEGAVAELWDYQKLASEDSQGTEDTRDKGDAESLEKLSIAIAKVQFVQVYMDDPALPMPEDTVKQSTGPEEDDQSEPQGREATGNHEHLDISLPSRSKPPPHGKDPVEDESQHQNSRSPENSKSASPPDELADPSTFEDVLPAPSDHTKAVPEIAVQPEEELTNSRTIASSALSAEDERLTFRPRLEQSPFSYMLGEENATTRTFSSSPSRKPQSRQGQSFLFGGIEDDNHKKERSTKESVERSNFDFGSLRRGRVKEG